MKEILKLFLLIITLDLLWLTLLVPVGVIFSVCEKNWYGLSCLIIPVLLFICFKILEKCDKAGS